MKAVYKMELNQEIRPLKLWLVKQMKERLPIQYDKRPARFDETAWGLALAMHMKCSEINYAEITANVKEVRGKPARTAEGIKNIIQRLSSARVGLLRRTGKGHTACFEFNIMSSLKILAEANKAEMAQFAKAKTDVIGVPA